MIARYVILSPGCCRTSTTSCSTMSSSGLVVCSWLPTCVPELGQVIQFAAGADLDEELLAHGPEEAFDLASACCCRALILQTMTSFIVPTGDAGALSSS